MKTCTFFGHRRFIYAFKGIENRLKLVVERLIKNGYERFIIGLRGEFDRLAVSVCRSLKQIYKNIVIEIVMISPSSLNMPIVSVEQDVKFIYYNVEQFYFKRRVEEANKCMVNDSDLVVCFIRKGEIKSGALAAVKFALKVGKRVINICDENFDVTRV